MYSCSVTRIPRTFYFIGFLSPTLPSLRYLPLLPSNFTAVTFGHRLSFFHHSLQAFSMRFFVGGHVAFLPTSLLFDKNLSTPVALSFPFVRHGFTPATSPPIRITRQMVPLAFVLSLDINFLKFYFRYPPRSFQHFPHSSLFLALLMKLVRRQ